MKNLDQLPSGSWRYRKQFNGKQVIATFDHKPSESEIMLAIATKVKETSVISEDISFKAAAIQYCAMKDNILSPSTMRKYERYSDMLSDGFTSKNINRITNNDIQLEINKLSSTKAPKTVRNYHAFITAVLKAFNPSLNISTTLPQKRKFEPYTPSEDDVRAILSEVKNTIYSIPFQLGVMGLRRSEICGARIEDIEGNYLHIQRAMVDSSEGYVIKDYPKTTSSDRKVYLSDGLIQEIYNAGCIYDGFPSSLTNKLHSVQEKLSIPKFRFHDLRAFYASYSHACGIPDVVIKNNCGWSSDFCMRKIYTRAMQEDIEYYQKALAEDLLK